jgi:hypothetical protein
LLTRDNVPMTLDVTITHVGRKWLTVNHHNWQLDKQTLKAKGCGIGHGVVGWGFLSQHDLIAHQEKKQRVAELRKAVAEQDLMQLSNRSITAMLILLGATKLNDAWSTKR